MAFLSKYTCRWRELAFGIESGGRSKSLPRAPSCRASRLSVRGHAEEERFEEPHQFQQPAFSAVLH
jgi:hypothetical protein